MKAPLAQSSPGTELLPLTEPTSPAIRLSSVQADFRAALLQRLRAGEYRLEAQPLCECGAAGSVQLAAKDRFGIPVGTVLCTACGLVRTSPRLATQNLPSFYDEIYHGLHLGVPQPDPSMALFRAGQGMAIHDYVADLLPAGALRVAEIGCGTGQVLREFRASAVGCHVELVGCEYAHAFVAAGMEAGTDIRRGGVETLSGSGPFDLVILSHVVEHFPAPVADLSSLRQLGDDRTIYYVEVPGLLAIHHKPEYGYRLDRYLTLAHTYHFSLATLTATMARAGFVRLRGDEGVRSLFRMSAPTQPPPDRAAARNTLAYVKWLRSSQRLRLARARQSLNSAGGRLLRRLFGERRYRELRSKR